MPSDLPTFIDGFVNLPDPRNVDQCEPELIDILSIAVWVGASRQEMNRGWQHLRQACCLDRSWMFLPD